MNAPTLADKLRALKVVPPSRHELDCLELVSHGNYEIGVQRTNDILDESHEVFARSSRSTMGVAGDSIVAIFTAQGDLVNASSGTYLHAIIPPIVIKYILKTMADEPGIRDGDIWYTNDALYGGIHNPDYCVAMPLFVRGKLAGWTAALSHTPETGACEPGGMPVGAASRFEEGFNVPPIKIGENFRLRRDLIELISAFGLRAEQMIITDLKARCTAADRARTRLVEMCEREGIDFVAGLFRRMLMDAEAGARRRISSWPDGTYRCVTFADCAGLEQGLIRNCCLTMSKRGDTLAFDFTGTSPENLSSFNAHAQAAIGHLVNKIYEYVFHDLPISNATFEPVDFIFPPNSCLNPGPRAATSLAVGICTGVMSAVQVCVGRAMFPTRDWQQVSAPAANAVDGHVLSGISQWNMPFADSIAYVLNTQGQGARAIADGMNAYGFCWCAFGRAPDVEAMENEFPMLVPFSEYRADSGGCGKYRGGLGTAQLWVTHHVAQMYSAPHGTNSLVQTQQPLYGGYAAPTTPLVRVKDADVEKLLAANGALTLSTGSMLEGAIGRLSSEHRSQTPRAIAKGRMVGLSFSSGGTGYGDPLDRDPAAVQRDLRDKLISQWQARNIYKVACDPETLRLDLTKTARLRDQERRARVARGQPFAAFEAQWSRRKPPSQILQLYGAWPDATGAEALYRP